MVVTHRRGIFLPIQAMNGVISLKMPLGSSVIDARRWGLGGEGPAVAPTASRARYIRTRRFRSNSSRVWWTRRSLIRSRTRPPRRSPDNRRRSGGVPLREALDVDDGVEHFADRAVDHLGDVAVGMMSYHPPRGWLRTCPPLLISATSV